MGVVTRAIAAALLLCGGVAAAFAQELSLRQPDGKTVTVIDDHGAGGPLMQWIERRNPDGSLDLAFGNSGRVSFSLTSADILDARSLAIDAQGRLILSGTAVGEADRSAAVVSRFLADGRADQRWGTQGTSRVASPAQGAARAVDTLTLPDQGMVLLGQIESAVARSVVLWRLHPDGAADTEFGRGGVLRLAPLDGALPTSLRLAEDDSVLIAVERTQAGTTQLEVHRWRPPGDGLQEVARQPRPPDWLGPVTLERRDGRWQWQDAASAGALAVAFVEEAGTSVESPGAASTFPFALREAQARPASILASDRGLAPPALPWAVIAAVAVLLGLVAWRRRAAPVADLQPGGLQAALVDLALRELEVASQLPAPNRPLQALQEVLTDATTRGAFDAAACPALGPPDDLTRIKGIGPVLEKRLHATGIFHFRQIAQWRPEDVAAVGARLSALKGRIERDRWVEQAIELSS